MVKTANEIWRDFETDLMPDSGAHKPIKFDIREWGTNLENFRILGTFDQDKTGSPWENITVAGKTGRIHRIADRLMLADGVDYTGANTPSGGVGTWLGQDGAGAVKMDYLLINAAFASVNSAFLDLTTGGTSSYAILGAARQQGRPAGGIIGVAGYSLNDGGGATPAWGGYFEAKRKTVAAGSTLGMEINISNIAAAPVGHVSPYQPHGGTMGGLWIVCGGGTEVNPTQFDAHFAIGIGKNVSRFDRGIFFGEDSLIRDGAAGSRAHAILLGPNQAIEWYQAGSSALGVTVVGNVTDAAHAQTLAIDNNGLVLRDTNNKIIFNAGWAANAVNYLATVPNVAGGSPVLAASGDDTNLDLYLLPKGTGVVRFGTYTATAGSITGYISIKDSTGAVRKLAVTT